MPRFLLILLVAAACTSTARPAVRGDFDFHTGTWQTTIRRRVAPLSGSTEWADYTGTTIVRKVWDGRANLVELTASGPSGKLELLSLRLYNPRTHQWALYVGSSRSGELSPPVIGGFTNGPGEFFSRELIDGRDVRVRFVISDITATSCRFEQAFSIDEGKTWEVNWIAIDRR
ncbi:MAG TPA: hypothetical protein VFQ53_36785 [Kofleriaceae bacterium]|nr:hypothetical protein [Kofleriaceae bacterium]